MDTDKLWITVILVSAAVGLLTGVAIGLSSLR